MIRPTIGRVVWYHPGPNDPPAIDATQPHAALIAHVENDRQVNLFVIDSEGGVYSRKSVRLAQDADKPESGCAQWPNPENPFSVRVPAMSEPTPEPTIVKGSKGATNVDGTPWIPPMPDDEPARRNGKQKSA